MTLKNVFTTAMFICGVIGTLSKANAAPQASGKEYILTTPSGEPVYYDHNKGGFLIAPDTFRS